MSTTATPDGFHYRKSVMSTTATSDGFHNHEFVIVETAKTSDNEALGSSSTLALRKSRAIRSFDAVSKARDCLQ